MKRRYERDLLPSEPSDSSLMSDDDLSDLPSSSSKPSKKQSRLGYNSSPESSSAEEMLGSDDDDDGSDSESDEDAVKRDPDTSLRRDTGSYTEWLATFGITHPVQSTLTLNMNCLADGIDGKKVNEVDFLLFFEVLLARADPKILALGKIYKPYRRNAYFAHGNRIFYAAGRSGSVKHMKMVMRQGARFDLDSPFQCLTYLAHGAFSSKAAAAIDLVYDLVDSESKALSTFFGSDWADATVDLFKKQFMQTLVACAIKYGAVSSAKKVLVPEVPMAYGLYALRTDERFCRLVKLIDITDVLLDTTDSSSYPERREFLCEVVPSLVLDKVIVGTKLRTKQVPELIAMAVGKAKPDQFESEWKKLLAIGLVTPSNNSPIANREQMPVMHAATDLSLACIVRALHGRKIFDQLGKKESVLAGLTSEEYEPIAAWLVYSLRTALCLREFNVTDRFRFAVPPPTSLLLRANGPQLRTVDSEKILARHFISIVVGFDAKFDPARIVAIPIRHLSKMEWVFILERLELLCAGNPRALVDEFEGEMESNDDNGESVEEPANWRPLYCDIIIRTLLVLVSDPALYANGQHTEDSEAITFLIQKYFDEAPENSFDKRWAMLAPHLRMAESTFLLETARRHNKQYGLELLDAYARRMLVLVMFRHVMHGFSERQLPWALFRNAALYFGAGQDIRSGNPNTLRVLESTREHVLTCYLYSSDPVVMRLAALMLRTQTIEEDAVQRAAWKQHVASRVPFKPVGAILPDPLKPFEFDWRRINDEAIAKKTKKKRVRTRKPVTPKEPLRDAPELPAREIQAAIEKSFSDDEKTRAYYNSDDDFPYEEGERPVKREEPIEISGDDANTFDYDEFADENENSNVVYQQGPQPIAISDDEDEEEEEEIENPNVVYQKGPQPIDISDDDDEEEEEDDSTHDYFPTLSTIKHESLDSDVEEKDARNYSIKKESFDYEDDEDEEDTFEMLYGLKQEHSDEDDDAEDKIDIKEEEEEEKVVAPESPIFKLDDDDDNETAPPLMDMDDEERTTPGSRAAKDVLRMLMQ